MRTVVFVAILSITLIAEGAAAQSNRAFRAIEAAFVELRAENWEAALAAARPAGQAGVDIIEWHRLRAREGRFPDYIDFLRRNSDWPGLPLLLARGEGSIPSDTSAQTVIAYFADQNPRSGAGSLRLIAALRAAGQRGAARDEAIRAWTTLSLTSAQEDTLLQSYADTLGPHHAARVDMLLWRGLKAAARRNAPRAPSGWVQLAEARIGLRDNVNGVDGLINAVPERLSSDAGLAWERFEWRMRKGRIDSAIELMRERSTSAEALGQPERWANQRRVLARRMMRAGRVSLAYELASRNRLEDGSHFADLEWLAGYLSLRYLDNPSQAYTHFQRFRSAVFTPISLGRAGYWEGRALSAMGRSAEADAAYRDAAQWQTSFYGQLAAEKVGIPMSRDLIGGENHPGWRNSAFAGSTVLRAALLLHGAGERALAGRFLAHLAETQTGTDLDRLADLTVSLGDPYLAVTLGKRAASAGVVLPKAYYALATLGVDSDTVPEELALAIARRESEFNPTVISPAGARGLMQVMPGTAQDMARALSLEYSRARLTRDAAYNAQLGTAYLEVLIEEFGDAYVLVAAGYNAGPRRPREWIARFGDPRASNVNAIDWIEHIPFRETRNYVMRVMESLPVYRARLTGRVGPLRMSQEIKGR